MKIILLTNSVLAKSKQKPVLLTCIIIISLLYVSCNENPVQKHHLENKNTFIAQKKIINDVAYGALNQQKLDIYLPDSQKNNRITIFYVHGGSWHAGDKSEAVDWAKYFQNQGYTFIALNYGLTSKAKMNIHPSQVNDISDAINFILSDSSTWELKNNNNVIMGASAGGHLAMLYAFKYNNLQKIKAVISFCGITDLTDDRLLKADFGEMNGGTVTTWLMGDTITRIAQQYKNASPLYNISQASLPTYFIHGKKDEIVPYRQVVKAFNKLESFGIASKLQLLERVDHDLLSVDLEKELNSVDSFLRKTVGKYTLK